MMHHAGVKYFVNLSAFALFLATAACSGSPSNRQAEAEIVESGPFNPFPRAMSVRVFAQPEPFENIELPKLADAKGRLANAKDFNLLMKAFKKRTVIRLPARGYEVTACAFTPRHVFRFYDDQNKRLGDMMVCFDCYHLEFPAGNSLRVNDSPEAGESVLGVDYGILKSVVRNTKLPTYAD
jgi:hypothetical protein